LLFIGCVAEEPELCGLVDWAIAVVVRVDRTASVAKPRRIKVFLQCCKRVASQCVTSVTVPKARVALKAIPAKEPTELVLG
jgi:hypothetical protein